MEKFNLIFLILWMTVSCSFSSTWSSSINNIFSTKDFLDWTVGAEVELFESIANGAQIAIDECHSVFYWDRWNCPETDFSRKQKQHVTREQAVIQSIMSAGITYAIAKNCSQGSIPGCGCSDAAIPRYDLSNLMSYTKKDKYEYLTEKNKTVEVNLFLKGCVRDINYAETVSKNILDKQIAGKDIQAKINLHNNNLGRKLIKESMVKRCRCHGVSGSCTMQMCWMEFPPFLSIAKLIRDKYLEAEEIELGNDDRLLSQNFESKIESKNKTALIFLGQSQNLCFPNKETGWPGTKGRNCSRDRLETTPPEERKSCRILCKTCGHRIRKVKRLKTRNCKCEFKWCCRVECQTCTELVDEFYCH